MDRIQAVIFDMDGVIFDSEQLVIDCWREIAGRHQIADMEETLRLCIGTNSQTTRQIVLDRHGADFPYEVYLKEVKEVWREKTERDGMPMKPGVRELLEWLSGRGVPTAIASSTRKELVTQELRDAGLLDYFGRIICGDMVKRSKPAPDIFLKAAEELGTAPENCLVIEDSHNGIRAAAAAGMVPVMVPDLLPATEEMRCLAVRVMPSLGALLEEFRRNGFAGLSSRCE